MSEFFNSPPHTNAFDVRVKAADLEAARAGDVAAKERIATQIDGLVLYDHILSGDDDDALVTVMELEALGIVQALRLYRSIPAGR